MFVQWIEAECEVLSEGKSLHCKLSALIQLHREPYLANLCSLIGALFYSQLQCSD